MVQNYIHTYTGEQVAQWDFQNNAPAFVLEVSLRNLLTSICMYVILYHVTGSCKGLIGANQDGVGGGGEFHISHDA